MMVRRLPVWPTLLVLVAALVMVRLGVWQLDRRQEKQALLARYAANEAKPLLPFVALWPVGDEALFRRTSLTCLQATDWHAEAGRSRTGLSGWRHLATCRTGVEGPGAMVDLGVSTSSQAPSWRGGRVTGRLVWAPSPAPLVARLFGLPTAPTPLVISEAAAPGLQPTEQPGPSTITNNHLSYAVQWFVFAALSVGLYALLLWRRWHGQRT